MTYRMFYLSNILFPQICNSQYHSQQRKLQGISMIIISRVLILFSTHRSNIHPWGKLRKWIYVELRGHLSLHNKINFIGTHQSGRKYDQKENCELDKSSLWYSSVSYSLIISTYLLLSDAHLVLVPYFPLLLISLEFINVSSKPPIPCELIKTSRNYHSFLIANKRTILFKSYKYSV